MFTIALSAAVNHNYDYKEGILKHRNTQNGSKFTNHRSQTTTFWTQLSKVLSLQRSAKKKKKNEKRCEHQLAFELQSSLVFGKRGRIAKASFFRLREHFVLKLSPLNALRDYGDRCGNLRGVRKHLQRVTRLFRSADRPEIYCLANQNQAIQTPVIVSTQGLVTWNAVTVTGIRTCTRNLSDLHWITQSVKWLQLRFS